MNESVPFPSELEKRYTSPRFVGSGGGGAVYAAHDENLRKDVAIKILSAQSSSQKLLRFQQEAKVISKFAHPNIVTALDFGIVDDKIAYLVMDLVGESSLDSAINAEEKLSVAKCVNVFKQIAKAMAYAHSHGVLHRDLKPGNVLIQKSARGQLQAMVADFGVAKIAGMQYVATTGSIVIGTPNYMSPEQFRFEDVDERSDIYSFGCLMFETLTGTVPFVASNATEVARMHEEDPIPDLVRTTGGESIPETLQEIVYHCLEKKPESRHDSFTTVLAQLEALGVPDSGDNELSSSARHIAPVSETLIAREPYLVSNTTTQFPIADSLATTRVLTGIVAAVLVIGVLICVSLMGWTPGISWLIPGTKQTTTDTLQKTENEKKKTTVDFAEQIREAHAERLAWKDRDVKLPESMLKGSPSDLLDRAKKQLEKKRYGTAVAYLDRVLQLDKNNVKALKMRSDAKRGRADFDGALIDISEANNLDPDSGQLIYKRAILRRETNDFNGAIEDLTTAIGKDPQNAKWIRERGDVYLEMGQQAEAHADYSKSISIEPTEAALRNRGKLNQINGKYADAIDDYTQALKRNPSSAEVHYLRGNSYNQLEQFSKAIADYTTAIELNGSNADFYKMRANAFERLGELEKANQDRHTMIDDFGIGK